MLTPQSLFQQAHARISNQAGHGRRARSGSIDSVSSSGSDFSLCSVTDCDKATCGNCPSGYLCPKHAKAVNKLMKTSFVSNKNVSRNLAEQRIRLLTAVVSARQKHNNDLFDSSSGDATSSMFWFSSGNTRPIEEDDAGSDKAEDDSHTSIAEMGSNSLPTVLPWVGPSRLATVVESDEEDDADAASPGRSC